MANLYLYLCEEGEVKTLSLKPEDTIREKAIKADGKRCRVSPIFPVAPGEFSFPTESNSYAIGFFCYEQPLQAIARLQMNVPIEMQKGLCFSMGLASVVFFLEDASQLQDVLETNRDGLRAAEFWTIKDGVVQTSPPWFAKPVALKEPICPIVDYTALPPEQVLILDEFSNALNSAINKSARYLPSQLIVIRRLCVAINDIIKELHFLTNPVNSTSPEAFSTRAANVLNGDSTQRQKLIHQRTGDLVQITASLTSAKIQAFTGAFPLLESPSPAGIHSLLGIGTAYRGLSHFSMFVEQIFQKYPIPKVIREKYHTPAPVDILPNIQNHNSTVWGEDSSHKVDTYLDSDFPAVKGKFNLVYYSLRIGFRESSFTTTAAIPTLTFCDEAKWSLMTLSHEILHAHVTAVLAAIFADNNHDLPADPHKRYQAIYHEQINGERREPHHFIDSLRSILYHYSVLHPQYAATGEKAARERCSRDPEGLELESDLVIPAEHEDLSGYLKNVFHEINELLVHVLDYHYFYDCNDELYLGLLWESWWSVPKVLHEVDQYIFRSLVAVASGVEKVGQSVMVRFRDALEALKCTLEKLIARDSGNVLALEALKSINNQGVIDKLVSKFHLGIYLADMARSFLWSKHIHGALYKDANCTKDEGVYSYSIETCEFRDIVITSPVALIADRLRIALIENESKGFSPQHRAAWLQLACASISVFEGGGENVS